MNAQKESTNIHKRVYELPKPATLNIFIKWGILFIGETGFQNPP